ncbi:hypothetical protein ACRAWC_01475 [Leifsonia sp. L25]|uniref:hypothetical protein n=1 Tax=Actinomycetes TaxID=1760 RepID=UPI003D68E366
MAERKRWLEGDALEARVSEIERSAELACHSPNPDAIDRARRILTEEITLEEASAEIHRKYELAEEPEL